MFRSIHLFLLIVITCLVPLKTEACSVTLKSSTPSNTISKAKIVYVKEDVDLGGRTIYLSKKSKLICRGGSIIDGEVVFNETELSGEPSIYCRVSGTVRNKTIIVDWFLLDTDLDHLYDNGVFLLSGFSTIEFHGKEYVSRVRGRNSGITLSDVAIEGNGATLMAKAGGSTSQSLLMFSSCSNISIKDLVLVGSEETATEEGARHNLSLYNCENIKLENVISLNAFTDGLYIRKSNHLVINGYKAYQSGRQGCSVTAGNDILFQNCLFDGSYRVAPMAGLDIEPNYDSDIVDNITVTGCVFTNNTASGLTIKLKQRGEGATCNIAVENCSFDGNGTNISVASAPYSGKGHIDIFNCTLKNSKGVSFQSKCYSATETPRVRLHNSVLENANMNAGTDVREQAAFISVHNISSHPLSGNFGNIEIHSLTIKQNEKLVKNIKRAISIYPDAKYEVENVSISNVTFGFEEKEGSTRLMYIPKSGVRSVNIKQ